MDDQPRLADGEGLEQERFTTAWMEIQCPERRDHAFIVVTANTDDVNNNHETLNKTGTTPDLQWMQTLVDFDNLPQHCPVCDVELDVTVTWPSFRSEVIDVEEVLSHTD